MKFLNTLFYSTNRQIRLLRHFLFWSIDFFNWMMVLSLNRTIEYKDVWIFLGCLPVAVAATYFILYVLIPKFSIKNQWEKLFLGMFMTIIMMGIITNFLRHFVLLPLFDPGNSTLPSDWKIAHIILEIFRWLAVITLAIAIKLIKNKTKLQQKNHQLEAEKRTLELQFLKAQMHPHFLFNTLNTLYSETLQHSDKAEQIVLHLSNLLRFILEECSKDMITLAQEIKVIEDYIALEKLRHDKRINVQFTTDTKRDVLISPLIFLTFVENSFKHTINTIRGTANISISIQSTASEIELTVINDYVEPNGNAGITSTKTGLTNVKQQLDLLYEEKYSLKHDIFNGEYCVRLKIPVV